MRGRRRGEAGGGWWREAVSVCGLCGVDAGVGDGGGGTWIEGVDRKGRQDEGGGGMEGGEGWWGKGGGIICRGFIQLTFN